MTRQYDMVGAHGAQRPLEYISNDPLISRDTTPLPPLQTQRPPNSATLSGQNDRRVDTAPAWKDKDPNESSLFTAPLGCMEGNRPDLPENLLAPLFFF